jgi:hypothetical protein
MYVGNVIHRNTQGSSSLLLARAMDILMMDVSRLMLLTRMMFIVLLLAAMVGVMSERCTASHPATLREELHLYQHNLLVRLSS